MIKVTIRNNTNTNSVIAEGTETIRELLDSSGIYYNLANVFVNHMQISAAEINNPVGEYDNGNAECTIACIQKAENA